MELADHFRNIWTRRWIVLGTALAAALIVFAWRFNQPTTYRAETQVQVLPAANDQGARPTSEDALYIAERYAQRASTRPILEAAGSSSGLGLDAAEVEERVEVATDPDAGTIVVTATGRSAADAAALSDSVAGALIETVASEAEQSRAAVLQPLQTEISELAASLAALPPNDPRRGPAQARYEALVDAATSLELRGDDRLSVVSPADDESDPIGPRPLRDAAMAFLVALILAAEAVALAAALRGRFSRDRSRDDVAATSGLPVLASVNGASPAARRDSVGELAAHLALMSPVFDAPSSVAMLATHPGVGCTQIAIDLARTAALEARTVLLVDADLRRPTLHERLGLVPQPGLAEVLRGGHLAPQRGTVSGAPDTLHVLPAGDVHDGSAGLTQRFGELVLGPAAEKGALTIIDTSPLSDVTDAAIIAAQCDTSLLVVDAAKTRRRAVVEALALLRQLGIVPLGIVLNGARQPSPFSFRRRPRRVVRSRPAQAQPGSTGDLPQPAATGDGLGSVQKTAST